MCAYILMIKKKLYSIILHTYCKVLFCLLTPKLGKILLLHVICLPDKVFGYSETFLQKMFVNSCNYFISV